MAKPGRSEEIGRTETKTRYISPYEVQQMRRTMSYKKIAEHYNMTASALWKWAHRHNIILSKVTDWEIAEEIWSKTPKQIAAEYNVSLDTVYKKLSKMGICTKQDGQR